MLMESWEARMIDKAKVTLSDEDLRELFAFFSSPTDEELHRIKPITHEFLQERKSWG